ncbi:MAG: hypothetical protein EOP07_10400 [Proteobacteria bacterium]|nr:MAG: hypothetical protein EOP07_10400 [Pseudomonadota bacterium]
MDEFERLEEIYSYMFVDMDLSNESFMEDLPNQGQSHRFLKSIRDRPLKDQAFFVRALVKFRPECKERLQELSKEDDEDVQVLANAGLLHTPEYAGSIEFFKRKIYERLADDSLNDGEWPIHFLLDYLMEEDVRTRMQAIEDVLVYAKGVKEINPIQLAFITNYYEAAKKAESADE